MADAILRVEKLRKYFPVRRASPAQRGQRWARAVDGIDFEIGRGETLSLVGESGCGKTTTAFCVLRLHTPTSGSVFVDGVDTRSLKRRGPNSCCRSVQAVFQDPYSSLSPRMRVRSIVAEPLVVNAAMSKGAINRRVEEVIAEVGLPVESSGLYPHEFSGGQRQRIAVARALALKPRVVVLDEPVSGLDVSIRAQVMNLLKDLQESLGVAYLLISHNLSDVRYMGGRVAVMYLGKIVESAPSEELFGEPLHPYTQALLSAALSHRPDPRKQEIVLPGEPPSSLNPPAGCHFHPRCFKAVKACSEEEPCLRLIRGQHMACCHLV